MAELKETGTESDPELVDVVRQIGKDVIDVMQQINSRRDDLAGQIMRSKSKKRAFDAYSKI